MHSSLLIFSLLAFAAAAPEPPAPVDADSAVKRVTVYPDRPIVFTGVLSTTIRMQN